MRTFLLALALASPAFAAAPPAAVTLTGKVVEQPGKKGVLVLLSGGKAHVLVMTEASRLFFDDADTRGRPMRVVASPAPSTGALRVLKVHSIIDGKPHDLYYWCERCQLRYAGPGKCFCCGDETERREEPLD